MTMQGGAPGFSEITWDDLRPDLVARFQTGSRATSGHASPPDRDGPALPDRSLFESLGLTQTGTDQTVSPTPEALLLFGTEDAISRHFPFLRTCFSLRDLTRNREKIVELPANIPECLEALGRYVASELPARAGSPEQDEAHHASLRDAAILPWLFEMAVSRDYTQTKAARLVRDRDHVFLEYPRKVVFDEDAGSPSRVRYLRSTAVRLVLARLIPTMQADASPGNDGQAAREKAYFGLPSLRVEGRFFKVMATLAPQDLHGPQPDHASRKNESEEVAAASVQKKDTHEGKPARLTMQVYRLITLKIKAWFKRKPASTMSPAPSVPEPARSPASRPAFGSASAVPSAADSRPAPHPESPRPPHKSRPPEVKPSRSKERVPSKATRPPAPGVPTPRADVSDRTARILAFCRTPRHRDEIQKLVGMNNRDHFRKDVLNRLIAQGLLAPTRPDKPNSPKQQYVALSVVTTSPETHAD